MAEPTGENYAAFNSRVLVEFVGDVTDRALEATRIKQFLGALAGRFFNWASRKSLFTLHLGIKCCAIEMAASGMPRFDPIDSASCSAPRRDNATSSSWNGPIQEVRRSDRSTLGADA